MLDDADVIRRKFKTAVTDSGREVRRAADKPGVTNLIDILSVATGETPEAIEARATTASWHSVGGGGGGRRAARADPDAVPGLRGDAGEAPVAAREGGGQGAGGVGTDARGDLRPDGVREL